MVYLSQGLHKADQAKGVAVLGVLDILPAIIGGPFFTAVFFDPNSTQTGERNAARSFDLVGWKSKPTKRLLGRSGVLRGGPAVWRVHSAGCARDAPGVGRRDRAGGISHRGGGAGGAGVGS